MDRFRTASRALALSMTLGLCALPAALAGEETAPAAPAPSEKLPTAKEVMERHIQASGGREAMEKIKNRVSKGKIKFAAMNIEATMESISAAPNLMSSTMVVPNMMTMKTGTDGKVMWQSSDAMGTRLLEGEELENQLRDSTFNSDLAWETLYKSVEVKALEDVNGKPTYRVEAITAGDLRTTQWFDKESGLKVKMAMVVPSQMGDIPADTTFEDYRDIDGVKIPFKTVMSQAGQEGILVLDEVKQNVDLPGDAFAMPTEVKKLIEQQKPADQ